MKRLTSGLYFEWRKIGGREYCCEVFRNVDTGRWHWRLEDGDTAEALFFDSRDWPLMVDAREELAKAVAQLAAEA